MADDRLSIALTHADGRITRLGPDETDAANIPQDLSFSTSIPGGFKDASLGLLRRLDNDWPDLNLFDNVRITGPGGRVAWEGRQAQFPRSHGDAYTITPGAVGWNSHLRDDPSFREIYIDRDLTHWRAPSRARTISLVGSNFRVDPFTASPDTTAGIPALTTDIRDAWASPIKPLAEGIYDAGPGLTVASLYYQYVLSQWGGSWALYWTSLADDSSSPAEASANLAGVASGGGTYTPATARRCVGFQHFYNATPAGGAGQQFIAELRRLVVFGGHGLTTHGTAPDHGLLGSHIVADVVSRAAPLLTYSTGTGGSIDATTFAIPHAVYREPVTAEYVITDINKYHLYDWGVWENREFFYRQPDPDRLCWEARLGDGAHMDADGLTGEQVINGVFVTYTDATGTQRTVGPPGGNFDSTSADLQDTSAENPANAAGLPAKWDQLTLSFPTNEDGAIQIGSVYLAERSLATRRGSLRLTGTVQHPTEGQVPVWRVRAGDWVRVTDLNGENASVQRKVISTSYTHSSRQITCELDNTPSKLSAILERVGVKTGIQSGGGF